MIEIEGKHITDIATFYEEINRLVMVDEDWKLGCSLDAFNDMLYGGYGTLKDLEHITLVWKDIQLSKEALGIETTREYYKNKLGSDSPFNQDYFIEKLEELNRGEGQTYFDILIEIIEEHDNVTLIEA